MVEIKLEINRIIGWIEKKGMIPATKKFDIDEKQERERLRKWDPFESTLSAAIIAGLEIIPINDATNILYVGEIGKEGRLNLLDLVKNKQKNFILNKESILQDSEFTNLENINNLEQIKGKLFSVVYINEITIPVDDIIEISKEFLDELGYLIVILSRLSKKKFHDSFNKLSEHFRVIQEVNIENHFRDTTLIVFSKLK